MPEQLPGLAHRWVQNGQQKVLVTANRQADPTVRAYVAMTQNRRGNVWMKGSWWMTLDPDEMRKAIMAAFPEAQLGAFDEDHWAYLERDTEAAAVPG